MAPAADEVAAVVAASANLSDHFQLNRLFALLGRTVTAIVRLLMAGFAALMAMEGLLTSGQDGAAVRVVGRAPQGALPIVGGQLADSAGALEDSAALLRGAVGVAGMAAVLAACAGPAIRLAVSMAALQLAAAVLEPVADPGVVRLIGHFSRLNRVLLSICSGLSWPLTEGVPRILTLNRNGSSGSTVVDLPASTVLPFPSKLPSNR